MSTPKRARTNSTPKWIKVGMVIREKASGKTTTIKRRLARGRVWILADEESGWTTADLVKIYEQAPEQPRKVVQVKPLVWVEHHVKGNGFYGHTATGAEIVYVYQPDFRARKYKFGVFQYWGANKDRCGHFGEISDPKTGKPLRFATIGAAKGAAQRYWQREVTALLAIAA